MDVQDPGSVREPQVADAQSIVLVGSVPADSLTEAMDVLATIVTGEEVYDVSVRERSFEMIESLVAELLSRSRMIHGQ